MLSLVLPNNVYAQSLQKIIVWEQHDVESKTISKKVIELNENGQKTQVYKNKDLPLESYLYDDKGRLVKESWRLGSEGDGTITYTYQANLTVIRETFLYQYSSDIRNIIYEYLNKKGQKRERKQYKIEGGDSLELKEWRKFYYNDKDSLVLEKLAILGGEEEGEETHTEYKYNPQNGKLEKINKYSDKELLSQTTFEYDERGRLVQQSYENVIYGHAWRYTLFSYKEEYLRKVETIDIYQKEVKIYKEGKLIRTKIYDVMDSEGDVLEYVGDYQYK